MKTVLLTLKTNSTFKVSQIVHGSLFRSESVEFNKQNNFVLIKYPPIDSFRYRHKFDFPGEPRGLKTYFLKSINRMH